MEFFQDVIWLTIAVPLLGAAALLFAGKRLREPAAGYIGSGTVGFAFLVAALASIDAFTGELHAKHVLLFEWIPALGINASLLWDPLSVLMTLVVTGVGFLIHVYSIGYMHGDERFGRFFAYLNLFIASMLILVLGDSFGFLFVGWELVGLSSFLLISFWFEKPSAAAAGRKAFVVNRIGDVGFLVAMMIIFSTAGSLAFSVVLEEAPTLFNKSTATAVTLLLLVGAAGKSAQIPLYIWLPDAMEGPTPVSALIHAATMVTAGVYLVARTGALFELAPTSAAIVATVGAITALFAATIAVAQRDIKRVLAYSTISQLGYMFMAVGAAAYVAGIFHLFTHAFFKALLFLGAGSVIHAMRHEQDMWKMGGLRKSMPITFASMTVAWLAISGIPPLAGFWSKDEILAVVYGRGGAWIVLWAIGLITAALTAFYMTRLLVLTFLGEPRWDENQKPHESPVLMTVPLLVLAGLSVIGGFVNTAWIPSMEHFLEPAFEMVEQAHLPAAGAQVALAIASVVAAVTGIALGFRRYGALPDETGEAWKFVEDGYRVDDLYGATIVVAGRRGAETLAFSADTKVIDGAVNGAGGLVTRFSAWLRPLQSGFARSYAVGIMVGAVGLVLWFITRSGI